MKLTELRIENFRSFEDETIRFNDYTCFVGPNGSGKSGILMALNVFFRESKSTQTDVLNLGEEDFHHRNTKKPIKITLTFEDLISEAQKDFQHYYRQGKLILYAIAKWDEKERTALVKQCGSRFVMKDFALFFEALDNKAKSDELKGLYQKMRLLYPDLPNVSTKDKMENALRQYEEGHLELCELLEDDTQAYGWTKGLNRLEKYIQWITI